MKLSELSSKKKAGLMIIMAAFLVAFLAWAVLRDFGPSREGTLADTRGGIPDGDSEQVDTSKMVAYGNTYTPADRMWDDLETGESAEDEDLYSGNGEENISTSGSASSGTNAMPSSVNPMEDILSDDEPTQQSSSQSGKTGAGAPKPGEPGYKEYKMNKYREETAAAVEASRKKEEPAPEEVTPPPPTPVALGSEAELRRSGTISSLESEWGDNGFSSLEEKKEAHDGSSGRPFECMFVRQEKLREGTRVSVRLLEDLSVGGALIPRNTHLQAVCKIGERLELRVQSLEMGSRIYTLGYVAYDTDGYEGIYCPDLHKQDREQAQTRGLGLFNALIGSRVGRTVSEVVQTGVSIAQSRSGEVTVTVPAGYRFFLVKSEE